MNATDSAPGRTSAVQWLWLVAAGVGGVSGLVHLLGRVAGRDDPFMSPPVVVGQLGLYAAPILLGILAGLFIRPRPVVRSLALSGVCLLIAAPLVGEGLICFILIVPVHLVVAPLSAFITVAVKNARIDHLPRAPGLELLLLLLPFAAALANRAWPPANAEPVTMVDSVIASAPPEAVWRSIDELRFTFNQPAPWLVRLGLPVPVEIRGGGAFVGAQRRVVFSNGVVVASVVGASRPTRLDLQLSTENPGQEFFDHWSVLGSSHFDLEALPDGRTRITHSTTYQPLSFPRWYFEPMEKWLGQKVQRHMIETYARQAFPSGDPVASR